MCRHLNAPRSDPGRRQQSDGGNLGRSYPVAHYASEYPNRIPRGIDRRSDFARARVSEVSFIPGAGTRFIATSESL